MKTKKEDKKGKEKKRGGEKQPIQLHRSMNVKVHLNQTGGKETNMLDQLRDKMKGSKFRWINEQLYTQSGEKSLEMIKNDKALFDIYHEGFREQVTRWPLVPVDVFIKMLKYPLRSLLIRRKLPKQEVGDFGCGDAKICKECPNQNVHSFDLVSRQPCVIACDIAHVPLSDASLDIAIFCLALMGTNWSEFILESNRCLKPSGQLWIAEVRSRFESESVGGEEGFVKSIEKLGFKLMKKVCAGRWDERVEYEEYSLWPVLL